MLLSLAVLVTRSISLENYLSLVAMREIHGTPELMLRRVLYMTYLILDKACAGADLTSFADVAKVSGESIRTAALGRNWQPPVDRQPAIDCITLRFDETIGNVPVHRFFAAWDQLKRISDSPRPSPSPGSRLDEVWM